MCQHHSGDFDDFAQLEDDEAFRSSGERKSATVAESKATFPCEQCGGTGLWRGGRNRYGSTKCFACKGKGSFKTSYQDRMKARISARDRKEAKLQEVKDAFNEAEPGLIETLMKMCDWNDFARSLIEGYQKYGALTEKQTAAAHRMIAKVEANRKAREEKETTVVDLTPVRAMFETSQAAGLKRPSYRAEGLHISLASLRGRNAGALYVKSIAVKDNEGPDYSSGEYLGKIVGDRFFPSYEAKRCSKALEAALAKIAADPAEAAFDYGKKTGQCAICARELTDPVSVARGIGPICAGRFGF